VYPYHAAKGPPEPSPAAQSRHGPSPAPFATYAGFLVIKFLGGKKTGGCFLSGTQILKKSSHEAYLTRGGGQESRPEVPVSGVWLTVAVLGA
jgi:hypothetical protein